MVRDGIAPGKAAITSGPVWIGAAQGRGRARVRIETQLYQRGGAPSCPVLHAGCRPPVSAEPGRRGARGSTAIIAGTGDNRNRHEPGHIAPGLPLVELGQVIAAHQPDEAVARIAPLQRPQRIDSKPRAQLALDSRGANRRAAAVRHGGCEPRRQRSHARPGLERIAGRNQPPHLVQPQRAQRGQADLAVTAMRGIEAPPQQADAFQRRAFRAGPGRCRAPATCRW